MENNTEQHSNSISMETKLTKAQRREFRRLTNEPRLKPWRIQGTPKVAWRIRKKWFNRFYKPGAKGRIITVPNEDGSLSIQAITGMSISKSGGRRVSLDVFTETLFTAHAPNEK